MKQNRFVVSVFLLALNTWCSAQDLQYSTNRTSGVSVALNGVATGGGPNVVAVGTNSAVSMGSVGANGLSFASNEVSKTALNLTALAYGNGMFVAGATNGALFTSADGAGWTTGGSAFASQNDLGGLAFNSGSNGTFVAVADGIPLIRWADAQLAQWHTALISSGGLAEFYYGVTALPATNTRFAVCGFGGVIRLSQDAGRTWTVAGANSYHQSSPTLTGIASGGGKLVCVGTGGRTMVSSDGGTNWTSINPVTANLNGVAYTGSGFIAVGDGGLILSSPDGAVWTRQSSQTTRNLYGVAFALSGPLQGVAVVVGAKGTLLVGGAIPLQPTSLGNQMNTYGAENPPLSVSVANNEPSGAVTVDWFDANSNPVAVGTSTFTPTNRFPVGTYVYYAQARDTRTEFTNATRTAMSLTITPAPLVITANAQTKAYGAALPALTVSSLALR